MKITATSGFTLIELMVSLGLFSILMMLAFTTFDQSTKAASTDSGAISASQSAQGALDIMLNDIRGAGENLDLGLGVSGLEMNSATKEIIVRKNITVASRTLITRMPLCVVSGTTILINGATSGTPTGKCAYTDVDNNNDDDNVQRWRSYFTSQGNIPQAAILYRPATPTQTSAVAKIVVNAVQARVGSGTTFSPYQTWVTLASSVPTGTFTATNGSVLVLVNERRYKLFGNQLLLALGGQTDAQAGVMAFNISDFTMSANLVSPTATVSSIALNGPWQRLQSATVTLTAKSPNMFGRQTVQRTYTGTMFPRNVNSSQTNLSF